MDKFVGFDPLQVRQPPAVCVGIVWFMLGLHVFVYPMLSCLKPSNEKRFEHLVSYRDNEATRSAGFARPEDC